MTQSVHDTIQRVLLASWRRRALLIAPVLVMLPLSVITALLMPRTYSTSALLLLQESSPVGPLSASSTSGTREQDQMAGIRALLTSDLVLVNAVSSIHGDALPHEERKRAELLRHYRESLDVLKINSDFFVVRLSRPVQTGLGRELEIILARLFETLLMDQGTATAAQQTKSWLEGEIDRQQRRVNSLRMDLEENISTSNRAEMLAELRHAEAQLLSVQAKYQALVQRYAASGSGPAAVLRSPDRIRVIDQPRDPVAANRSRLVYLLFGIAAGVGTGLALALAAEVYDDRLHEPTVLASAPRGTLHVFFPYSRPTDDDVQTKHRTWRRAVAVAVVLIFLLGTHHLLSRYLEVNQSFPIKTISEWLQRPFIGAGG